MLERETDIYSNPARVRRVREGRQVIPVQCAREANTCSVQASPVREMREVASRGEVRCERSMRENENRRRVQANGRDVVTATNEREREREGRRVRKRGKWQREAVTEAVPRRCGARPVRRQNPPPPPPRRKKRRSVPHACSPDGKCIEKKIRVNAA